MEFANAIINKILQLYRHITLCMGINLLMVRNWRLQETKKQIIIIIMMIMDMTGLYCRTKSFLDESEVHI